MTFPELPVPPKLKDHPAIPVLRELYRQATVRGHSSQWVCEIANLARDAIDLILTTPAAPQAPVEAVDPGKADKAFRGWLQTCFPHGLKDQDPTVLYYLIKRALGEA